MSRTIRIPLFPLGGALLFPRSQLPLHIFEPRYRSMVSDAASGPGRIGMIQPLRDDDDNRAPLHAVGCLGEIGGIEELDDGRFNIVLVGTNRFRLVEEAPLEESYRLADVDIAAFDDSEPEPDLVNEAVLFTTEPPAGTDDPGAWVPPAQPRNPFQAVPLAP